MANIAKINIRGTLPYNCYCNKEFKDWLAVMNAPTFGVRIQYEKEFYVPNQFGGKTSTWQFKISGEEAMWQSGVQNLVDAIKSANGSVTFVEAWDMENMKKMNIKY